MALVIDILSWILVVAGGVLCLIGGLGILRLPDLFTRMHAAGIVDTVGIGFVVLGLILQAGFNLVTVKLHFILVIILFTSPVATHALAQAALSMGLRPLLADDAENEKQREDEPSKT